LQGWIRISITLPHLQSERCNTLQQFERGSPKSEKQEVPTRVGHRVRTEGVRGADSISGAPRPNGRLSAMTAKPLAYVAHPPVGAATDDALLARDWRPVHAAALTMGVSGGEMVREVRVGVRGSLQIVRRAADDVVLRRPVERHE